MDAPQLPNAPDSFVSQIAAGITFTLSVIGFVGAAVFRFLHKRNEAHPDDVRRSDTIELINSASIKNDLAVIIEGIHHIVADLQILKNREEAARFAREEVARLLLEERSRKD